MKSRTITSINSDVWKPYDQITSEKQICNFVKVYEYAYLYIDL